MGMPIHIPYTFVIDSRGRRIVEKWNDINVELTDILLNLHIRAMARDLAKEKIVERIEWFCWLGEDGEFVRVDSTTEVTP